MSIKRSFQRNWRVLLILLTLVVLSPLVFPMQQRSKESKCGFLVILTLVFWISEVLPLPITALIPTALGPMLGIYPSKKTAKFFLSDMTFLVIGNLLMVAAVEKSMLHKRIALMVLQHIGVQPRRLMFILMVATAFISMCTNNVASSAMMLPIVKEAVRGFSKEVDDSTAHKSVVINEGGDGEQHVDVYANGCECQDYTTLRERRKESVTNEERDATEIVELCNLTGNKRSANNEHNRQHGEMIRPHDHYLRIFILSIAYSANIGSVASIADIQTSTKSGKAVEGLTDERDFNVVKGILFCLPISILMLVAAYVCLNVFSYGTGTIRKCIQTYTRENQMKVKEFAQEELNKLAKLKFNEKVVICHLVLMAVLWVTRKPGFAPGWDLLFQELFITDGVVAMFFGISLVVFAAERPTVFCFRRKDDNAPSREVPPVLPWNFAKQQISWKLIFLLGGVYTLSNLIQVSGLLVMITTYILDAVRSQPDWIVCLTLICCMNVISEFTSNDLIATLLFPVLRDTAISFGVNPLYLMLPANVATSMVFMLPMATASNGLVYSNGETTMVDMIKYGVVLKVVGVCVTILGTHTWGTLLFNFHPPAEQNMTDSDILGTTVPNLGSTYYLQ